jgi:vacuolar iron transporter family protein
VPATAHTEKHFTASETVRDIVIGMSDGLTVPFALAAGLSGATLASHIVVTAGLAEIVAGSIAMGLGGYLAAKTDMDHYRSEKRREFQEIDEIPEQEKLEVAEILKEFGMIDNEINPAVDAIASDHNRWVDFMMRFELGLESPDPKRASQSAFTIGMSYIVGGFIPLSPYIFFSSTRSALFFSIIITLIALAVFGFIKGHFTGLNRLRGALQTVIIGGLAAGAAFLIARMIS